MGAIVLGSLGGAPTNAEAHHERQLGHAVPQVSVLARGAIGRALGMPHGEVVIEHNQGVRGQRGVTVGVQMGGGVPPFPVFPGAMRDPGFQQERAAQNRELQIVRRAQAQERQLQSQHQAEVDKYTVKLNSYLRMNPGKTPADFQASKEGSTLLEKIEEKQLAAKRAGVIIRATADSQIEEARIQEREREMKAWEQQQRGR